MNIKQRDPMYVIKVNFGLHQTSWYAGHDGHGRPMFSVYRLEAARMTRTDVATHINLCHKVEGCKAEVNMA